MTPSLTPRSLAFATDIDVLGTDSEVRRDGDHLVVRSPGNPGYWWGNFLLFDDAPGPGDGERWEAIFDAAFADVPAVGHRSLCWDRDDGAVGAVDAEFLQRGYRLERNVGLIVAPDEIHVHERANRDVEVRALDPNGDEALWEADVHLLLDDGDDRVESPAAYEAFLRGRQRERRQLFAAGRGAWYVALDPSDGALLGSCGVVATGPRGRFQAVGTAAAHRGRGIASRLVAEAATDSSRRFDLATLVIVADAEYHALAIYESLGFRAAERTCSIERDRNDDA